MRQLDRSRPYAEVIGEGSGAAAFVLLQEFDDRLNLEQRILCVCVDRSGPESVGWEYAARLFALWRDVVEVRV